MKKERLKMREPSDIQEGSVFINCERDSMLRVLRIYDVWCQHIGVPGGHYEKHVDYITWRPNGVKIGTKSKMRLDSLTRLPYFQVNAVHVYCVGGQSFGFGLTPEPEPAPAPICPQIDVSLVEEIEEEWERQQGGHFDV